jgi:hypothetical protein
MSWRFDSLFLQGIRLRVFPYRSDEEIPSRCWVKIVDGQVEHISLAIDACQSQLVRTSAVSAGSTIWPHTSPIDPASSGEACFTRRLTQQPVYVGGDPGWRTTNSPKVRQSFPGWASYLPEMPEPKVYEFSKHIWRFVRDPGHRRLQAGR